MSGLADFIVPMGTAAIVSGLVALHRMRSKEGGSRTLFYVSYQYVAGPVMTQPASVDLTQKPSATSIVCAQ